MRSALLFPNWFLHQSPAGKRLVQTMEKHAGELRNARDNPPAYWAEMSKVRYEYTNFISAQNSGPANLRASVLEGIALEFNLRTFDQFVEMGQRIVSLPRSLWTPFMETDLDGLHIDDFHMPFESFYLHLQDCELPMSVLSDESILPAMLEGILLSQISDLKGVPLLRISLVPKRSESLSDLCITPMILIKNEAYLADCSAMALMAVNEDLEDLRRYTSSPKLDEPASQALAIHRDLLLRNQESLAPLYGQAINLVLNAVAYITAYPEELGKERYSTAAPANLVHMATQGSPKEVARSSSKLQALGFRPYFEVANPFEDKLSEAFGEQIEAGPRPHLRRGHWARQAHGPKRSLRKWMWRLPCLVNAAADRLPVASKGLRLD